MATVKVISSKASIGRAINYVTQEKKTNQQLISGFNLNPLLAAEQMQITKKLYNKTDGRTYKHFVLSYHKDEDITPEKAHALACEFAAKAGLFQGFEVLIATHTDAPHIHTHFIVNSVNSEPGKKIHMDASDLQDLRDLSDEICLENGLTITKAGQAFEGGKPRVITAPKKETYRVLQKHLEGVEESYVYRIFIAVMNSTYRALSKQHFIELLNREDIDVTWNQRKYITFTDVRRQMEGEQKCKIRNKKLEQYFNIDFSKEALQKQFDKNAMAADQEAEALEKVNLSRNDCRAICEYVRFTFTAMAEEGLREIPCEELANQVIQHTDAPPLMQDKIRTFLQRSNLMQEKQSTGEVLPVGSGPGPRRTIMQLFLRNLEEEAETMRVRQPARQRNRGFELD